MCHFKFVRYKSFVIYIPTGCDPSIMGIGPVPAIEALLKAANKQIGDIDLIEVIKD